MPLQGGARFPGCSAFVCPHSMKGSNIEPEQAGLSARVTGSRVAMGEVVHSTAEMRFRQHNKSPRGGRLIQKWTAGMDRKEPKTHLLFQTAQACWSEPHVADVSISKEHALSAINFLQHTPLLQAQRLGASVGVRGAELVRVGIKASVRGSNQTSRVQILNLPLSNRNSPWAN